MKQREIHCDECGALLAKAGEGKLTLRRGGLDATFEGTFEAYLTCYKPYCQRRTLLRLGPSRPSSILAA